MNNIRDSFDRKTLELIILPTEDCNFRCTYCYEDFAIGRMKKDTINNLKKFIFERIANLNVLKLSWFGGEPLLAKKIILEIHQYIDEVKSSNLIVISHFTTNAYLLDIEFLDTIAKFGPASFQISLDGFGEQHDQTRRKANGNGTFNVIWHNLKNMRDSECEFSCMLRMHVTPENGESVIKLAKEISKEFSNDKRFSPYVMKVGNWGGPNKENISSLNMNEFNVIKNEIMTYLAEPESPEHDIEELAKTYICYASKPNSFVIRADGRVNKCTVHLKSEQNQVGHLDTEGKINLNSNKMHLWMRGFNEEGNENLLCPAKNMNSKETKYNKQIEILDVS